ncbi:MJ1477/TM1410 family putative glycoside hydrolase [Planococcus shenhongbingii]|uniref:Endo alpha-1,4 polygalactosaminidase n=1 Tax=Planococcus shenhongbingii TaxID=3058398 RepID=A0ABT8NEH1_9BACL|nr:MJ1477/TM1410 family putative glycoside hydrolase [Planococcus sp. N017]MDN7246067.1 endo alpha-1,4 polygalactosaminidase [Planococcus sp. N017]
MLGRVKIVSCFGLLLFLAVAGCSVEREENTQSQTARGEITIQKTWLYQLQNTNPVQIADSGYEIAVIDPTVDGKTRFTKEQIDKIKASGTTVLAYLSIGEASAYLPYWQTAWGVEEEGIINVAEDAPEWIGRKPNPDWPESVKVRYWDEHWWNILEPELDKIKGAGFDGLYLDIVDAYFYWGDKATYLHEPHLAADPQNEKEAAERMMNLVKRISAEAKESSPDFQVFPQNAESIFDYDDGSYLTAIDGIGAEDLWYEEAEKSGDVKERLPYLEMVRDAGKEVLSIDYVLTESMDPDDRMRIEDYKKRCAEKDFFCFPAMMDRELDKQISHEEHGNGGH